MSRVPSKRLEKRRRCVEHFLETGRTHEPLRSELIKILGKGGEERVDVAIQAISDEWARRTFSPHIQVFHENPRPSSITTGSITMFALCNGVRRWMEIELPDDIANRAQEEQAEIVAEKVAEHRACHGDVGKGDPFLGLVTGYLYRPTWNTSFEILPDNRIDPADRGRYYTFSCVAYIR